MLIPLGHEGHALRRRPWVTWTLAVICIGVFIDQRIGSAAHRDMAVTRYVEAVEYLVEHPWLEPSEQLGFDADARRIIEQLRQANPSHGLRMQEGREQERLDSLTQEWRFHMESLPFWRYGYREERGFDESLLTHQFIHADWMHLIGNLIFLLILGPPLESALGHLLFPALYLVGGAAASLFHAGFTANPEIPLGGASGAVAVLMGMFVVRYGGSKLRFLLILFPIIARVRIRAWIFLVFWALTELAYASVFEIDPTLSSGVAHLAHFGGFGFGIIAMFALGMLSVESRFVGTPREESAVASTPGASVGGGTASAAVQLADDRLDAAVRAWDATLEGMGGQEEARPAAVNVLRALRGRSRFGLGPTHGDLLRDVLERHGPESLTPDERVHWATMLQRSPGLDPPTVAVVGEMLVDSAIRDRAALGPDSCLDLVRLDDVGNPQRARRLAEMFLTRTDLEPATRHAMEEWVRTATQRSV